MILESPFQLTELEHDSLSELANIGVSRAAANLKETGWWRCIKRSKARFRAVRW
jgi:hypothetical protein